MKMEISEIVHERRKWRIKLKKFLTLFLTWLSNNQIHEIKHNLTHATMRMEISEIGHEIRKWRIKLKSFLTMFLPWISNTQRHETKHNLTHATMKMKISEIVHDRRKWRIINQTKIFAHHVLTLAFQQPKTWN